MTAIVLNGEPHQMPDGSTVALIVRELGAPERGVAVAVDGEVVPRGRWADTRVLEGQHVEVLRAVQGGRR